MAEDFPKLVPPFSFIRFNTPCFLFLEGCSVCNPCLQVRNIMSPYKENIGLPTTSKKCLSILSEFNALPGNIFLFLFLLVSFYPWIAVNSVPFLAVLTVIVGHSFFTHGFYEKTIFLSLETFNNTKISKTERNHYRSN